MNPNRTTRLMILILLALSAGLSWQKLSRYAYAAWPAAATLTVTSTGDAQIGAAGCADGCSLREAIAAASAGDEIRFSALFNTPQTITLAGTELTINKNLTITGPGANLLTISGNNASRVFYINSGLGGPTVTLDSLTIAAGRVSGGNNSDNRGGGIYINDSTVIITNCAISGNSLWSGFQSKNFGGGIYNFGFLTLINSTISGNSLNPPGGDSQNYGVGIHNDHGSLTLINSTVSGNRLDLNVGGDNNGGGIYSADGLMTITNSTLSGNEAGQGAAIYNYSTTLTLTGSTIADNTGYSGSGIYSQTGQVKLRNTIIARNTGIEDFADPSANCPEVKGGITSQGHNLIGKGNCSGLTNGNNSDQVGTIAAPLVPMLGPLASNGGPTQTHALLTGSPAIDTGDNCVAQNPGCLTAPLTTDQRGASFPRKLGAAVDIGAFEFSSSCQNNPIVSVNADSGAGSLREAIANACPGSAITFNLPATATITLTTGQLVIDKNLTITGPGANLLTISGNQASRVFNLNSGVTAAIGGLTISGGNGQGATSNGNGGAIASFGDMTLRAVHLTSSTASQLGGGIYAEGPLTIEQSAITNNTAKFGSPSGAGAGAAGGGVHSESATLTLTNTTVSGNRSVGGAGDNGGGVWSTGTTTITACTITDNEGYGIDSSSGVSAFRGTVTIRDSIVAANRNNNSIPDVLHNGGGFVSGGHNLIGNADQYDIVAFNQAGDQAGTAAAPLDPKLGPLANNGGPTPTHRLLSGSPAINAGDNCVTQTPGCLPTPLTTDQRGAGFPRKVGAAVDIGAFEYSCVTNPVVTTNADSGAGSLRDAIANACPGGTITFNLPANSTITLTTGQLVIDKNLTVNGPGANLLTISGNQLSRVFNINSGVTATLNRLTIADGKLSSDDLSAGGGIYNAGTLNLTNCALSGNSISGTINNNNGGGIYSNGTLTIANSTFSGNRADGFAPVFSNLTFFNEGAAVYNAGTATITNSIFYGNAATGSTRGNHGAAVFNSGGMTITNSTLSGNEVSGYSYTYNVGGVCEGGGIYNGGQMILINNTISGNLAGGGVTDDYGGGIYNGNALTIINCTITKNSASGGGGNYGGGIFNRGTVSAKNTIIAGNIAQGGAFGYSQDFFTLDANGFISQGYNLIGDTTLTIITGDTIGNQLNANPLLGPLADNGGPTQTHRLLPGSPAINAGDNCVLTITCAGLTLTASLTTDQRGFNRSIGGTVDIGAVEVNYALAATGGTPQSAPINTAFANPLQATLTESGLPAGGAQLTFNAPINGASATFPNGASVTTNNNGQANVTAMANGALGLYQVTASASGLSPVTFNLTNTCPTITLAPLPQATAGVLFNAVLSAAPVGGNYQFSRANLPAWLTLAPNGNLSGTPPATGTFNFNVSVSGFGGACGQGFALTLTAVCPTIVLLPLSLPNAAVNTAYSTTLTASPASSNYNFAVTSGLLPAGLTLNSNGTFSGASVQSGTFNFRVTASGFGGCSGFHDYTLIVACADVMVNPNSLPDGTIGTAYNQFVSVSPGGAYNYAVSSGALPLGLLLNATTGAITGTPTTAGTFNFTITASAGACAASRSYSITIVCQNITLASLTDGAAGVSYAGSVAASPAGSYIYSLAAGTLPSGLMLNTGTGALSGIPTVPGTYNFSIKAQAPSGCSGTQSYSLTVGCPAITLSTLPAPSFNLPYGQTVSATPSGGGYRFAVTAGALPAGLSLNPATGFLSGTPTVAGAYNFTITATGFGSCAGNRAYTGTINGGSCPTITLPSLPNGAPGQLYNASVAATPSGSYSYAVTAGALPPGLTLYDSFGLLYGYPTQAGTFNFTVTATDANNCIGAKSYNVVIGGASVRSLVFGDFDGDGKADLSVWRGQESNWLTVNSRDGKLKTEGWGTSAAPYFDVMTPGDYDGDGKMDLAVFRKSTGEWLIKGSKDGAVTVKGWGLGTDIPVPGDYDGDGKTDIAVWRGADTNWYILRSSDGQTQTISWGTSDAPYRDVPVPEDYDSDGKTDIAVLRQANGHWYIRLSSNNEVVDKAWGVGSDVPVAADYDGDGKADIAVWRGAEGAWYVLRSSDGEVQTASWGTASLGDVPVPGDYDGDGKADFAVWRETDGNWYIKQSRDDATLTRSLGQQGDTPITRK